MDSARPTIFRTGYWIWDEVNDGLLFITREANPRAPSTINVNTPAVKSTAKPMPNEIKFRETVDNLEMIRFRRHHQRRCKPRDPHVITIQDVKDVALYIASITDLSADFIKYFHIPTMDRFLRALIVYFQSYIQVWDSLILKREEVKKKLYQPVVTEMENVIRDDLADLRAMVAREYCSILIGAEESKQFHHMSSSDNTSLSDKDRKMFEMFICMSVRVVWIALQRKHLSLIELETNRLLRTDIFNLSAHRGIKGGADLCKNASEERILTGTANTEERKLLHRSPITKELILGDHEHRMLIIGNKQFQPTDERLNYLEVAYAAPEEHLLEMGLVVGMLGIPRAEYDAMLMTVVREAKQTSRCRMMPVFKLPPKEYHSEIPKEFPKEPTRFPETRQKINARKTQCKMWLKTLKKAYEGREMSILDLSVTQSHVLLLTSRSSVSVVPRASQ